jgi:hypothetical protein
MGKFSDKRVVERQISVRGKDFLKQRGFAGLAGARKYNDRKFTRGGQ